MLCATDLYSGHAVGLLNTGILRHAVPDPRDRTEFRALTDPTSGKAVGFVAAGPPQFPGNERLARVVATSGAFPLSFESFSYVSVDSTTKAERQWLLADGGLSEHHPLYLGGLLHVPGFTQRIAPYRASPP
jgi:hypothetical protein